MMSYIDFVVPMIILVRAFINFARTYKLIADKGDLYYTYKKDWKEHFSSAFFFLMVGIVIVILVYKNRVDLNSLYIYEKYYNTPIDLFSMDYYDTLYETLVDVNKADLTALKAMQRTLSIVPSLLAIFMSFVSDFAPVILIAGIYSNGIFDGKRYYTYEEIKSYKIDNEGNKTILTLILYNVGLFSREHKEVTIFIKDEEIKEIENYLRHEIRDKSVFEKNVQSTI